MVDAQFLELRKKIIEKDFDRMNDKQKQAIFQVKGPVLILAVQVAVKQQLSLTELPIL